MSSTAADVGAVLSPEQELPRYEVRQVLYIAPRSGHPNITPVQVTEEIRRTTLQGVILSYAVRAWDDEDSFVLDHSKQEVFPSADAARIELRARATAAIDAMVDGAAAVAQTHFPHAPAASQTVIEHGHTERAAGTIAVRMPDGNVVMARVKGPAA